MKIQYDQKHFTGVHYDVGEVVVMIKQPNAGQPSKLQAKYREKPLQIIEVQPSDTYRVAELATDGREIFATTAHVSQLKSWRILREEGEDVDHTDQSCLDDDEDQSKKQQRHEDTRDTRAPRVRRPPSYLKDFVTK